MNICVFCGSKDGVDKDMLSNARALGRWIASKGHRLVYGGANIGLMGAVADGALEEKGEVIGVLPEVLRDYELAHESLTEFHWVATMHERKAKMEDLSDLFIALPGGVGTLEEFFEQLTWKQIGVHQKPLILFDYKSFYKDLIHFMQGVERAGFLREGDVQNLSIVENLEELDKFI